jgi:hypothetical protein
LFFECYFLVDQYYHVLNIYHWNCKGPFQRKGYLAFNFFLSKFCFKMPFWRIYFFGKSRWLLFLRRIWALNLDYMTFPFYNLPYCRPIQLISKHLQKFGHPTKNFFFSINCYDLAICPITFTKTFSIHQWDSKVQDFTIETGKKSFHFNLYPSCQLVYICVLTFTNMVLKI